MRSLLTSPPMVAQAMTAHYQDSDVRPEREVAQDVELEDVGPHQRLLPDVCEFARREGCDAHPGYERVGEPHHGYPEERDPPESKEAADGKYAIRDHATLAFRDVNEVAHCPQRMEHCQAARSSRRGSSWSVTITHATTCATIRSMKNFSVAVFWAQLFVGRHDERRARVAWWRAVPADCKHEVKRGKI